MNLEIRNAQEQDIQVIIQLRRQLDDLHAEIRPDVFVSANIYNEQDIKTYFDAEKSKVIVVETPETNEPIAYAVLNIERMQKRTIFNQRSMIYVNDICVREDFRGKGVGKFIFNYIVDYAKNLNVDAIELDVFASNNEAIRLYETMGMKDKTRRMELIL
jgi:diamine N-acetyltransferase